MQTNDLTLVIPAYNDEASLRQFLPELLEFCGSHGFQLVIVDDCSKDKTGVLLDEAAEKNAFLQVFHHKVNRGYGGALISGLRLSQTRFSVTLDADGQHRLRLSSLLIYGGRGRHSSRAARKSSCIRAASGERKRATYLPFATAAPRRAISLSSGRYVA